MSYGEPKDVPGECGARLHIADNYGDNHATMRCSLEPGHPGRHREEWRQGKAVVEWEGCDREAERKADEELAAEQSEEGPG